MNRNGVIILGVLCIIVGVVGFFAFGQGIMDEDKEAYTKKWEFKAGEIQRIALDSDFDMNVKFVKSSNQQNYIEMKGALPPDIIERVNATEVVNGALNINLNKPGKLQFMTFNFPKDQELTMYYTEPFSMEDFEANMGSHNLSLDRLQTRKAQISGSSGNIDANNITAEQIAVEIQSGNIDVNNITAGQISLQTQAGNIDGIKLKGQLEANSSSGNIEMKNVEGDLQVSGTSGYVEIENHTGKAKITTSSGNIGLAQNKVAETVLETTSGNVIVRIPKEFAGFFDVHSNSGSISVPETTQKEIDVIKVRTSSGNIDIEQ